MRKPLSVRILKTMKISLHANTAAAMNTEVPSGFEKIMVENNIAAYAMMPIPAGTDGILLLSRKRGIRDSAVITDNKIHCCRRGLCFITKAKS